ncbi:UvrD-helicase domain-containing protein [Sulfitobacter sp. R18_1]|uniref:UvrD-helicase domain-containing protein n=1 Tax=Sulfitobacter sp. R18_1 TaxID=2821104 RepID=UPI001ADB4A42|nr:UvrD-helicase domain-containing protein [Sulfitobacter sp. R18_1]MBO9428215.1 UvrD-helicase domain-containing protein [Sulfitobacter sp. R18_1]
MNFSIVKGSKQFLRGIFSFDFTYKISIKDDMLTISSVRREENIYLYEVKRRPSIVGSRNGIYSIYIETYSRKKIRIRNLTKRQAYEFETLLIAQWAHLRYNLSKVQGKIKKQLHDLQKGFVYPSSYIIDNLDCDIKQYSDVLIQNVPLDVFNSDELAAHRKILSFEGVCILGMKRFWEIRYLQVQKETHKKFLDEIESNPLTKQQRSAVLTSDDACLVLAGAGSGKTSVIVAKVAHNVINLGRDPREILVLAYNRKAAEELRERLSEKIDEIPTIHTFHGIGRSIIKEVEGVAPRLTDHANDPKRFSAVIGNILRSCSEKDNRITDALFTWLTTSKMYREIPSSGDSIDSIQAYDDHVSKQELRTVKGHLVKSYEELLIANWLYFNNVPYIYEADYRTPDEELYKTDSNERYRPDFFLERSNVYIEHFGVRKEINDDGSFSLETRRDIDRDKYISDMEWKKKLHAEKGTKLICTYSYERQEGILLESLKRQVMEYECINEDFSGSLFDNLNSHLDVKPLNKLIGDFLNNFKMSGMSMEECKMKVAPEMLEMSDEGSEIMYRDQTFNQSRASLFMTIFEAFYKEYTEYMGEEIEYEDMISKAAMYVNEGLFNSVYSTIIVDEFQDISRSRSLLVHALKDQYKGSEFFAVGDDWQSIYRFAGSDVSIMKNFGDEFGVSLLGDSGVYKTIDLGKSFRCSETICRVAKNFIERNSDQIPKTVDAFRKDDRLPIRLVSFVDGDLESNIEILISEILCKHAQSQSLPSILILFRYRYLMPYSGCIMGFEGRANIKCMTIHASKGLEADHVIIAGVEKGKSGFPSMKENDPILECVLPERESFSYAEERRILYVALTRAKLSVQLLFRKGNQSTFVDELEGLHGVPLDEALKEADPDASQRKVTSTRNRPQVRIARHAKNKR